MPHIPRLICATCGHEMAVETNSVTLNVHTKGGQAYYLIQSDLWRCTNVLCAATVFLLAQQAFMEHIHPSYAEQARSREAQPVWLNN